MTWVLPTQNRIHEHHSSRPCARGKGDRSSLLARAARVQENLSGLKRQGESSLREGRLAPVVLR